MDVTSELYVVSTTFPREARAREVAREMVQKKYALCVQVETALHSIYVWEGEVCEEKEVRVVFKCLEPSLILLEKAVLKKHPYECPEWICVRADKVSDLYGAWARSVGASS
jgi:periplasmic divalent cation tolerance protein